MCMGTCLELHGGELVKHIAHGVADDVPRDLVVGLRRGLDRVSRHVVERDDVLEHAHRLVEWAESVVRRVTVKIHVVVIFSHMVIHAYRMILLVHMYSTVLNV